MADILLAHMMAQKLDALPTPTGTAVRMLELAVDAEATPAQFAGVVTTDPGLALQVLRDSNSPERRDVPAGELERAILASKRDFLVRLAYTTCTPEGEGHEAERDRESGMTALRRHSYAVAEAAAFAVPHASLGEDLAVAVALRAGRQADEAELRGFLFGRLAEYKIPSAIVFVDAIPKGDTGKVQRTTLHDKLGHLIARPFVAPGNDVERSLQAIFGEVLGCAAVGVHDNFFMRGGDSLKGTQVMSRIVAQHAIELALPVLFRHPTVAALAVEVQARGLAARRRSADVQAEIDALSDEEVTRLLAEEEARGAGSGG